MIGLSFVCLLLTYMCLKCCGVLHQFIIHTCPHTNDLTENKCLLLWPGFVSSFINFIWLSVCQSTSGVVHIVYIPWIFISCTHHQVEDQGGVDNDGFEQELEVTIFGFISQTVQFLVAAPVSREQLWLLITAAGLEEGITETEGVTTELTLCALKQCEHKLIRIPLWQTQRGVTVWLVPSGTKLC